MKMAAINFIKRRNKGRSSARIKKIAAIGISMILSASYTISAFDTYDFPQSFINENEIDAEIVVGSNAALDVTYAQLIIDELKNTGITIDEDSSNLQDKTNLVRIIYKDDRISSDDRLSAIKNNNELNYGETLEEVSETNGFDDSDSDFLNQETFKNGISDEDYQQTLKMFGGEFNYAFRDDIETLDKITDGIYYDNGDSFARYTIDFNSAIDLDDTTDLDNDMVGEVLTIMGNEFTIVNIDADGSDLNELELIGGTNKISLEEDERRTIEIDGEEYEIYVNIVTENKVSLEINGKTKSIDLFDTDEISGVTIAVTDLVDSSRDSVNGFAEIVIGGQKIKLQDNNRRVEVNEREINDKFEKYDITSDFSDGNNGMDTITITYKVDKETLLEEGDYLEDVLFNRFKIRYEGIDGNVNYNTLEINVDDDTINLDGKLFNNDRLSRGFIFTTSTNGADGETYLQGDKDDDRIFFSGSNLDLFIPNGITKASATEILIDFTNNDIEGSGFLMSEDTDNQYLYEITNSDSTDKQIDLDEIFDKDTIEEIQPDEFDSEIALNLANIIDNNALGILQLDTSEFGEAIIAFNNDLILDFSNIESTGVSGYIEVYLDTGDADGDNVADILERYTINLGWDVGDEEFDLMIDSNDMDFVNSDFSEIEDNDDVERYVTIYGTQVEYDTDTKDYVKIMIPEKQVRGEVDILFGNSNVEDRIQSMIVNKEYLNQKKDELIDDGYEIVKIENLDESNIINIKGLDIILDTEIDDLNNKIIIGGPAVNSAAAKILGLEYPTLAPKTELNINEAVIRYYDGSESLLIYGYAAKDTRVAVEELLKEDNYLTQEIFISTS